MSQQLTIALAKGRILKDTLPLLSDAGIEPLEDMEKSRKLIFPTNRDDVRLLLIRSADVPTYVQHGAADLGVAGKDVLLEHGGEGLYELLDLNIACCKLMTAALVGAPKPGQRPRIATKYTRITQQFFQQRGQQAELIKLYGSMELAPIVELADLIVDLVDTGNTLKANGLEPLEHIMDISSRMIVNRASLKMKNAPIKDFLQRIEQSVKART